MERILEKLRPELGEKIQRDQLSSSTRGNLNRLEEHGFDFEEVAYKFPVHRTGKTVFSYLINGIGPNGEDVKYARYETAGSLLHQTFLYIDGVKHMLYKVLAKLEEDAQRVEQIRSDARAYRETVHPDR